MKNVVLYDNTKTYMFPNGDMATPEVVLQKFPAVAHFDHVIETDEEEQVLFAIQNLAAMKSLHKIPKEKAKGEAVAELHSIVNTEPVHLPSAEERMAAAMEFQNLTASNGGFAPSAEIVNENYKKGLWNKNMVAEAVLKSALKKEEYEEMTGEVLL